MIRDGKCKFCGGLVRTDDERRAVFHIRPTCDQFKAHMAKMPVRAAGIEIHRDGVPIMASPDGKPS